MLIPSRVFIRYPISGKDSSPETNMSPENDGWKMKSLLKP